MTKPVITGKVAQGVFERVEREAYEGKRETLDALYFILGKDEKAAIENLKSIIERLELIEQAMSKLSQQQIHAASKLLEQGNDTTK